MAYTLILCIGVSWFTIQRKRATIDTDVLRLSNTVFSILLLETDLGVSRAVNAHNIHIQYLACETSLLMAYRFLQSLIRLRQQWLWDNSIDAETCFSISCVHVCVVSLLAASWRRDTETTTGPDTNLIGRFIHVVIGIWYVSCWYCISRQVTAV